jgi:hypothetical protein
MSYRVRTKWRRTPCREPQSRAAKESGAGSTGSGIAVESCVCCMMRVDMGAAIAGAPRDFATRSNPPSLEGS